MAEPATFKQVVDLWATRVAMQRDVQREAVSGSTAQVRLWYLRNSIPEPWFDAVVKAARRRGFAGITYASLSAIARAMKTPEAI